MKWLATAASILAFGVGAVFYNAPQAHSDSSVVEIATFTKGGKATGSGFVIGSGIIITANHVVDGATKIEVRRRDGHTTSAVVIWQDQKRDVAEIAVSQDFITTSDHLDCSYRPSVGDPIEAIGNPQGLKLVHTLGSVAGLQEISANPDETDIPWQSYFLADITILPGNSGGPVYGHNGVVGIAVGTRMTPISGALPGYSTTGIAYVVPSGAICAAQVEHRFDSAFSAIAKHLSDLQGK